MRLTCPNCDAQYEVDASLVPASGRDVQCSNCGKTWFQEPESKVRLEPEPEPVESDPAPVSAEGRSGDGLTDEAAEFFGKTQTAQGVSYEDEDIGRPFEPDPGGAAVQPEAGIPDEAAVQTPDLVDETTLTDSPVSAPEDAQDEAAPLEALPESGAADPDWEVASTDATEGEDAPEELPPGAAEPQRPEIDAAVLGILKAEAEREIAARRAETEEADDERDAVVADPDRDAERSRQEIGARTARLRGEDEPEEPAEVGNRRALLPDIDEINSTLTATSDRAAADAASAVQEQTVGVVRKRRGGFRLGFSVMMLLTAAVILSYLFAPQITAAVPSLEPPLAGYVDWVNGIRQNVDGYLERSVNALTTLLIDLTT